jgi:exonuclease 3'-5' domain-containing protein 2
LKDQGKDRIPPKRLVELQENIKEFYKVDEVSQELLQEAASLDPNVLNDSYAPHGKKVVDFFVENEGLISLEKLWRQNFLDKMKPKFLPPLWSVDHQKQRLDIRAQEKRITPSDYTLANGKFSE